MSEYTLGISGYPVDPKSVYVGRLADTTTNLANDYSASPLVLAVSDSLPLAIKAITVSLEAPSTLHETGFGDGAAVLPNGLNIRVVDAGGSVLAALWPTGTLTRNADFYREGFDVVPYMLTKVGNVLRPQALRATARVRNGGLYLWPGHRLEIVMEDDYSGLAWFGVTVSGIRDFKATGP